MTSEQERAERWLQRLIGNWTSVNEASAAPGETVERSLGTETVRTIGGTWISVEGRTTSPESFASTSLMTLGYDASRRRIVGAIVSSMMSTLWVYEGALDDDDQTVTLDTEGPSYIVAGATGRYRDAFAFDSDTQRVFTSSYLGEDGEWHRFMRTELHRVE